MKPCTQVHIVRARLTVPSYLLLKLLLLVELNGYVLYTDDSAQLTVSVYDDKSDEQTLVRASQVVVGQSSQYKLDGVTGLYQTSVIASAPQQGYVQEETLNAVDYAP